MRRNKLYSNTDVTPEFYDSYPSILINRSSLLEISSKRLDILKSIESSRLKNSGSRDEQSLNTNDLSTKFTDFKSYLSKTSSLLKVDEAQLDIASHFILKLLCCDDDSNCEWFVSNESKLFEFNLSSQKIENFFKQNPSFEKLSLDSCDEQMKSILSEKLAIFDPSGNTTLNEMVAQGVYPIHYSQAPNLLSTAVKTYLPNNGYFYLCGAELSGILVAIFRDRISEQLVSMKEQKDFLLKDPRLNFIIGTLSSQKLFDFALESGLNFSKVSSRTFERMFIQSELPPCTMRVMKTFTQKGHLKNNGRYQFISLCKSLDFTEKETLSFVSRFEKSEAQKVKEFNYGVSHHYGSVGSGTGGKASGCKRLMEMSNKDGLDYPIGCPFVNNMNSLSKELASLYNGKLSVGDIEDILSKQTIVERCRSTFSALHGSSSEDWEVTSPQRWIRIAASKK